jgi:cytoskeletal protein CcmA (bactofilin family)
MCILILLGGAVVMLSSGTLKVNAADAQTNRAYYAAESGVTNAIEQIKYEASCYYADMLASDGTAYISLYNNFFTAINQNASLNYTEPAISGVTTLTTFTTGAYDVNTGNCEFLISCTATAADGTRYVVDGKAYIKRIDVRTVTLTNWITPDAAIKAGGTLDLESKNSVNVTNGDIIVSTLSYTLKNDLPYVITGGDLIVDPNTAASINDVLTYPSYVDPVMPEVDLLVTENNYTINWANMPPAPVYITTADDITLHFTACTIPEGIVYVKGDLNLSNCNIEGDIYCDGNIDMNNYCSVSGNIYCRGNMTITNVDIAGEIYCDGIVSFNNGTLDANIYAGGSIDVHEAQCGGNLYSPGPISIEGTTVTSGIVYSSTKLTIGRGSTTAIFFSGGDIEFTGDVYVNGTVIAKNNIFFKVDANLDLFVDYYYSAATIDEIINDPDNSFFFTVPGVPQLNEDIFAGDSITAVGRVN